MREAFARGRQAVLLVGGHLAEGARMAVRQEDRIVAEAGAAARRPDQRAVDAAFELFEMAVGPGEAERRDEMRLALRGLGRAALLQQALDPRHRGGEILARPGPARRMNAGLRRRAHRRTRPESSARAGSLRRLRRGLRLDARHCRGTCLPVSSGSGRPSSPADTLRRREGASRSLHLARACRHYGSRSRACR